MSIPLSELFSTAEATVVAAGAVLLAIVAILGDALRTSGVAAAHSRRVVHMLVGLTVAGAPFLLGSALPLYVLAIIFVAVNAVAKSRSLLPGMHEARPSSLGTVLFPAAVLPALALTWSVDPARLPAFQLAFLVLAIADPVASWVGESKQDQGSAHTKTIRGSIAFGLTATVTASMGGVVLGPPVPLVAVFVMAVSVGLVTTAAEALGKNGWDNLFIVLGAIGILVPWLQSPESLAIGGAVVAGCVFAALAHRLGALSWDGALAGGLLAVSLIAWVPAAWMAPALAFFVLSSILSVAGRERKSRASQHASKGSVRDAEQVLANGGVAWILLGMSLGVPLDVVGLGALGAFAAAAADTWATELGTALPGSPRSLRSLKRVSAGTSGAVSAVGTLASALGAASVALAAWAVGLVTVTGMGIVILAGFLGALADSLAGATLQAQYRNPVTGNLTERRPAHQKRTVRGFAAVNNEVVNAIGTATGACVALLLGAG